MSTFINFRCAALWTFTALVSILLVGCGVPTQEVAQPLPSDLVAQPVISATPTPSPSQSPSESSMPSESPVVEVPVDLWFAGDLGLEPVSTLSVPPITAEAIVAGLVAGPPVDSQLRTVVVDPLTGEPLISVFTGEPIAGPSVASVNIALAPEFVSLPPNEQVLVLGQVVISISGAGLGAVSFVDSAGSAVAVPLPDGRLLDGPATSSDYIELAAEGN